MNLTTGVYTAPAAGAYLMTGAGIWAARSSSGVFLQPYASRGGDARTTGGRNRSAQQQLSQVELGRSRGQSAGRDLLYLTAYQNSGSGLNFTCTSFAIAQVTALPTDLPLQAIASQSITNNTLTTFFNYSTSSRFQTSSLFYCICRHLRRPLHGTLFHDRSRRMRHRRNGHTTSRSGSGRNSATPYTLASYSDNSSSTTVCNLSVSGAAFLLQGDTVYLQGLQTQGSSVAMSVSQFSVVRVY